MSSKLPKTVGTEQGNEKASRSDSGDFLIPNRPLLEISNMVSQSKTSDPSKTVGAPALPQVVATEHKTGNTLYPLVDSSQRADSSHASATLSMQNENALPQSGDPGAVDSIEPVQA